MEVYWLSILGVLALCSLLVVLAIHSGSSKGFAGAWQDRWSRQTTIIGLYRIDRVHMNSVEALAPFVVPAALAMMVGVGAASLATLVWTHLAIRLLHLGIYLRGGNAAKGGSVRTILYVSGARVFVTGWAALNLPWRHTLVATVHDKGEEVAQLQAAIPTPIEAPEHAKEVRPLRPVGDDIRPCKLCCHPRAADLYMPQHLDCGGKRERKRNDPTLAFTITTHLARSA